MSERKSWSAQTDLHFRVRVKEEYRVAVQWLENNKNFKPHLFQALYEIMPTGLPNLTLFAHSGIRHGFLIQTTRRRHTAGYYQPELHANHASRFCPDSGWWSVACTSTTETVQLFTERVLRLAIDAWDIVELFATEDPPGPRDQEYYPGPNRYSFNLRKELRAEGINQTFPIVFPDGIPTVETPHPFRSPIGAFVHGERERPQDAWQAHKDWATRYDAWVEMYQAYGTKLTRPFPRLPARQKRRLKKEPYKAQSGA